MLDNSEGSSRQTHHHIIMNTTIKSTLAYWIAQVGKTRKFGHTYVHANVRQETMAWKAFEHDGIIFSYSSYGRSLNSGGHKYKVSARYAATGKPVSTKVLKAI